MLPGFAHKRDVCFTPGVRSLLRSSHWVCHFHKCAVYAGKESTVDSFSLVVLCLYFYLKLTESCNYVSKNRIQDFNDV